MSEEVVKETAEDSVEEVDTPEVEETAEDENGADVEEVTEDASEDENASEEDEISEDEEDEFDEDNPFGYEEFEYDEEGNIIIPENNTSPNTEEEPEKPTEGKKTEANDLEARLAAAEQRAAELEKHAKKILKGYGVEAGSVEEGLIKLAAESAGVSVDEYTAAHKAELEAQEHMLKSDLEAIHAAFPETRQYKSILDIPNIRRFGEMRDMGLSPKEAYSAANPDLVRSSAAQAAKKTSSGKDHLRSVTGRSVASKGETVISGREMRSLRDLFPGMTDAQIRKLYKDTL